MALQEAVEKAKAEAAKEAAEEGAEEAAEGEAPPSYHANAVHHSACKARAVICCAGCNHG